MRCDEIEQALNGEMADFKAAARHIKKCPYCSKIYKDELELEYSLRDLSLDNETIDITPELYSHLEFEHKKVNVSSIIKRRAWTGSALFMLGLIAFNLESIITLFNKGVIYLNSWQTNNPTPQTGDLTQMAESFKSSDYFHTVLFIAISFAAMVFYYLWREFREITK